MPVPIPTCYDKCVLLLWAFHTVAWDWTQVFVCLQQGLYTPLPITHFLRTRLKALKIHRTISIVIISHVTEDQFAQNKFSLTVKWNYINCRFVKKKSNIIPTSYICIKCMWHFNKSQNTRWRPSFPSVPTFCALDHQWKEKSIEEDDKNLESEFPKLKWYNYNVICKRNLEQYHLNYTYRPDVNESWFLLPRHPLKSIQILKQL